MGLDETHSADENIFNEVEGQTGKKYIDLLAEMKSMLCQIDNMTYDNIDALHNAIFLAYVEVVKQYEEYIQNTQDIEEVIENTLEGSSLGNEKREEAVRLLRNCENAYGSKCYDMITDSKQILSEMNLQEVHIAEAFYTLIRLGYQAVNDIYHDHMQDEY